MIVRASQSCGKGYDDLGVERRGLVNSGFEGKAILSGDDVARWEKRVTAAVGVGRARGQLDPLTELKPFKLDRHVGRRFAKGKIEDMGRDSAHRLSHFLRRS